MRSFAEELDWIPSYEIQGTFGVDSVAGHLIVEHGLENAAAISFIRSPRRASDLSTDQLRALLSISYNNLVEWHLFVSANDVRFVNNLVDRSIGLESDRILSLNNADLGQLLSASRLDDFDRGPILNRSLKACDDALLQVISRWKALLRADYPTVQNRNLSALFNAIIFVRGCEDRDLNKEPGSSRRLAKLAERGQNDTIDLIAVLKSGLSECDIASPLSDYIDEDALAPFHSIDRASATNLLRDFYAPRDAAYEFNFALMSKHALSRIYEKYVALFDPAESAQDQLSFVSPVPLEVAPLKTGAIYTPQFISGFFSRYVRDNLTPKSFRELRTIDPACGSGLFLRTVLELQCDPFIQGVTTSSIKRAFSRTEGIDKDPNACEATRLSLALLHLTATGVLPASGDLKVLNANAIRAVQDGTLQPESYGAVITNPPYVKLDHLSSEDRDIFRKYLGEKYVGRIDAYIPFVELCTDLVQVGGFVCLVLPQTFLTAANAVALRSKIAEKFDVRCLIDLSAVPVFDAVGAYALLLVVQRHGRATDTLGPPAQVAQVTEGIGAALQACLDGRFVSNRLHSVFLVEQDFFRSKNWVILSPSQLTIDKRLRELPRLSNFMVVAQGFVTGADDIFIRARAEVPKGEDRAYIDYLPDRQIGRYNVPKRTQRVVFYPYDGARHLDESDLAQRYPQTWAYLVDHQDKLAERKSVTSGETPWWRPVRSRDPAVIKRPKIVCPHLMLTPRFAVDETGRLAVSRSPFIIAREEHEGDQKALIRFFAAVLNSSVCNWYLRAYAPKYARGYNRLEVNLLSSVPVPDLAGLTSTDLSFISDSVERLSQSSSEDEALDKAVDRRIGELYGFTPTELSAYFGL
jgi:anti-anti-sigma regulatory factor